MTTKMQSRRGTSAEWAAVNPILPDGEIGYDEDTRIIKVGDGVTTWSNLPNPAVQKSELQARGDLLVGTKPHTVGRLPIGSLGQRLVSKSDGTGGRAVGWSSSINPVSEIDAKGDLLVGQIADKVWKLSRGTTGQRLSVKVMAHWLGLTCLIFLSMRQRQMLQRTI